MEGLHGKRRLACPRDGRVNRRETAEELVESRNALWGTRHLPASSLSVGPGFGAGLDIKL